MADSAIEQKLMAKIHELDDVQKERVLDFIKEQFGTPTLSLKEWLDKATTLRQELVQKYGKDHFFGVQDTLDQIREEASWPRGS